MEHEQLNKMLDDLEMQISEGKKVPLTNQYVINRETVIAAIQDIRDSLPDAVQEASRILADQHRMKEESGKLYEETLSEANSKARSVLLESKQRADKTMHEAQNAADALYLDAERQAKELVAGAEQRARELVSQTKIMADADKEATRILADARAEGDRDLMAIHDHCEKLLRQAEDTAIAVANELREVRINIGRDR